MPSTKNELAKREVLRLSNEEANKLTRECLQTALLQLMMDKPLEKITVTELVARSGVSRSAFYRNYSTKEDVLNEYISGACDLICQSLAQFSEGINLDWFRSYFCALRDISPKNIEQLFRADFLTMFVNAISPRLERFFYNEENRYVSMANMGAISTLTIYWVKNGMQESPEEMAEHCMEILK